MNILVYVVLNALFFSVVYGSNEKYRGNQLLELKPSTQEKSMKLSKFMDTHKASTGTETTRGDVFVKKCYVASFKKVEVWSRNGSNCQIQMTAQGAQLLKSFCQYENINYKVVIADVKRAIDTEIQHNEATISFGFNYEKFNRYGPIVQELFRLQRQFAHLMSVSMVGRSYEDRPLFLVRISECMSGCQSRFADDKPIIWIDGGIHAREWISVAAALYMMKQVMTRYGADDEMTDLLRKNTFYFVPVFNPDGYEYTFTSDRMWRKTRTAFNRSTFCTDIDGELMAARGADANRNWDVMWGGVGTSSDPCNLLYKGVSPESEPCVKLYADMLRWKQHQLKSYWSLHSFFEVLFSPNSYTDERPHDYDVIKRVGIKTTSALKKRFGTPYVFSTSFDLNMPVTGGSIDYVHDKLNLSFAYVIELRPRSAPPGFLLEPSEIIPTALETLDGILAGVKEIDAILQQKNTKPRRKEV